MPPRAARLAAGLAAAAGAVWLVQRACGLLEERRCRLHPLTAAEWKEELLRRADRDTVAAAVQRGGMEAGLRREVWPLLLRLRGDAAPDDAASAKEQAAYDELQRRCSEMADDAESSAYAEASRVIAVDVPRTPLGATPGSAQHSADSARLTRLLCAYAALDEAVGYCQGMSEICARFLDVFRDNEAQCFAAFAAFITTQRSSFLTDVSAGVCVRLRRVGVLIARADAAVGRRLAQLRADDCSFVLRPAVVLMLREVPPHDAATLLDVLMASPEDYLELLIAAALLRERKALLHAEGWDDLLHVVNNLTGRLQLGRLLADTRQLQARLHARNKLD